MEEDRAQAAEDTQQDFEHKMTISTLEAVAEGYEVPEPVPEPVKCKYCGNKLLYYGIRNPLQKKRVLVWRDTPERCTCQKAQDFWRDYDAKEAMKKAMAEAENKRADEMQRFGRMIERSGVKGRFQQRRFENFVQDTPGRRKAYTQAVQYAENFERMLPKKNGRGKVDPPEIERNGLFIAGSYGTGKTHLAAAIANRLLDQNIAVICMTMIDLLDRIRETYSRNYSMAMTPGEMNEAAVLRKYQEVPLLIIDDIGSEQPTEWGVSKIFAIVNARYEAYMPTIITTNYSGAELEQRMTPEGGDDRNAKKTLDRLKETCVGIEMSWESWRVK